MTLTHSDGFPVVPVPTDALLVGMGERFDVMVTLADGVFPLVASAEGKKRAGRWRSSAPAPAAHRQPTSSLASSPGGSCSAAT